MSYQQPVGDLVSFTATASSVQSSALPQKTQYVRVVAVTEPAHIAIGTNPTATTADYYVVGNRPEVISIGQARSQPVVGITTGTTTTIEFQEGTGSQFTVGDTVNLTVTDQDYYDDAVAGAIVTEVNTKSANGSGDGTQGFGRIIVCDANTVAIATAYDSSNYAELRNAFKVAGIRGGGSNAVVKVQQVQVVGG